MTGPNPEPPPYGGPPQYGAPPPYGPPAPYPPAPPAASSSRGLVIALVSIVGVLAVACLAGIAGVVWYVSGHDSGGGSASSEDIAGLIDYRATHPEWLGRDHRDPSERIEYPMKPAAGGPHHPVWQQCNGDVYPSAIDEGNAVHSLEHGAVWITYQPDVPAAEVEKLAARVRGKDYLLLSPYEGQPARVSLQAWGYQLRVSSVDDSRIDAFILRYRQTATMEAGVPCSTGSTATRSS
jgi:hypothetical protein